MGRLIPTLWRPSPASEGNEEARRRGTLGAEEVGFGPERSAAGSPSEVRSPTGIVFGLAPALHVAGRSGCGPARRLARPVGARHRIPALVPTHPGRTTDRSRP